MNLSGPSQLVVPRALLWVFCVPWLLLALFVALPAVAQERAVPPLDAHVNDTANLLSPSARAELERKLTDYEQKSGHQFALLTIDSLQGDALESFSIRVVEAWKLGKKGKDDGLLLLVANKEHKLRIEVGYGLEGSITDAFSSRVIRNVLVPAMRAGNPAGGFDQAFSLLMKKASGDDVAAPEGVAGEPARGRSSSPFGWLVLLFFISPILIPFVLARIRGGGGGGGRWGGGGFGGGGWGGGGFGGGGFGGGGGWGGGGGGGGGFSGGGGGGFGGGGASDSW
ncbi:MAG TPA: TPM domain-containing protein [Polyangiaceae bacterium]|nr:TPM domain-containing protein [Polyangiaceae bacterium]